MALISAGFIRGFVQAVYPVTGSVTLKPLATFSESGDTFGTSVTYALARKLPARLNILAALQIAADVETCEWHLTVVAQTVFPKIGDEIVDAAGLRWKVELVEKALMEVVYCCTCTRLTGA